MPVIQHWRSLCAQFVFSSKTLVSFPTNCGFLMEGLRRTRMSAEQFEENGNSGEYASNMLKHANKLGIKYIQQVIAESGIKHSV